MSGESEESADWGESGESGDYEESGESGDYQESGDSAISKRDEIPKEQGQYTWKPYYIFIPLMIGGCGSLHAIS